MKNWFYNLRGKMERSMEGRYGVDELTAFMPKFCLVLILLSLIKPLRFLYIVAILLMLWSCVRCFSKKMDRRYAERDAYLRMRSGVDKEISFRQNRWADRKTHRYFKCKQCKTILRVPKGKGKIEVSCPKCHEKTIKKT